MSPTWKTGPTPTQVLPCQADGPSTTSQRVLQICARCICCWALQHEAAETQHTSLKYEHHAPRTRSRHSRAAETLVVIVLEAGLLYRLTAAQHRLCSSRNALSPHTAHHVLQRIQVQHRQWLAHAQLPSRLAATQRRAGRKNQTMCGRAQGARTCVQPGTLRPHHSHTTTGTMHTAAATTAMDKHACY